MQDPQIAESPSRATSGLPKVAGTSNRVSLVLLAVAGISLITTMGFSTAIASVMARPVADPAQAIVYVLGYFTTCLLVIATIACAASTTCRKRAGSSVLLDSQINVLCVSAVGAMALPRPMDAAPGGLQVNRMPYVGALP